MADDKKTSDQTIKELEQIAEKAKIAESTIKDAMEALRGDDAAAGLEKTKGLLSEILDSATKQGMLTENQAQNADLLLSKQREILELLKQEGKITQKQYDDFDKNLDKKEKALDLLRDENYELEQQFKKLADIDTRSFGIVEKWKAYKKKMSDLSPEEATRAVMNKMADVTNSIFLKIVDASLEFDKVTSKVSKTLSTTKFASAMEDLREEALFAGASVEELGENFISLSQNYSNFTRLDSATAKQLASTATALNAAGFSAIAFAKTLDIGVKTLGMSEQQVDRFSRELVNFGKAADIPLEKLSNDLAAAGPQLAKFGANAENTFKKLSLQAKSAGIELNRMFQITEQYTTFEGAANAAAKLNSVLGGNFINSLDLMNASLEDPAEAIRLMKDSMDASGKSFDDMPNSMKRVIAEAAGFSDVSEAARIFGMESDEASDALQEQAATQEELNKMSRGFLDVQEKLNKLLSQMTPIVMPIVKKLGEFVDVIAKFVQKNKEVTKAVGWVIMIGGLLAAAASGLAILFTWVSIVAKAFTGLKVIMSIGTGVAKLASGAYNLLSLGFAKIAGTSGPAAAGQTAMAGATTASGTAARISLKPMLALAGAILMIGAGIGIAAAGLGYFVKSFSMLNPAQLDAATTALIVFGLAVVGLFVGLGILMATGVAEAAILALLGLGAAVMMIGVGIGVAAAGLGLFIQSVALVADNAFAMLIALTLLGAGIFAFGMMLWPVITPITAVGTGILAIGGAFILAALGIKIGGDALIKFINDLSAIGPITMLKFAASAAILSGSLMILAPALFALGVSLIPLAITLPIVAIGALLLASAFFVFAGAVKLIGNNMTTFISSLDGFAGAALELSTGLAIIAVGIGILSIGLFTLGVLGSFAVPVLWALGGSVLIAGIGFALFAKSLKEVSENIGSFIQSAKGFGFVSLEMTGGLLALAGGIWALGLSLASFVLIGGAGSLLLSNLFRDIAEGSKGANMLMTNLEKVPTAALAYKEIASAIELIAEALDEIDEDKLEAIASVNGARNGITATPASVNTTIPTIQVNEIIVKNTIIQENATSTPSQNTTPVINIELSVPVKIEGNEFRSVITKIAEEQITKNANNASSVNLRIK